MGNKGVREFDFKLNNYSKSKPFKFKVDENGCWVSTTHRTLSDHGFLCLKYFGERIKAHRLFYKLFVGDTGEMFVMHTCNKRDCFNPEHLYLISIKEEFKYMMKKKRESMLYENTRNRPC